MRAQRVKTGFHRIGVVIAVVIGVPSIGAILMKAPRLSRRNSQQSERSKGPLTYLCLDHSFPLWLTRIQSCALIHGVGTLRLAIRARSVAGLADRARRGPKNEDLIKAPPQSCTVTPTPSIGRRRERILISIVCGNSQRCRSRQAGLIWSHICVCFAKEPWCRVNC